MAMAVQSYQDLFVYSLESALDMEQRLVAVLGSLASEVDNPDFRQALIEHQNQTQHHADNVQKCLQIMRVNPVPITCYVIEALKTEHDAFAGMQPSKTMLTAYDLDAGEKTEHYEIGAYNSLILLAESLGQSECIRLLEENLGQEYWMARTVERIGRRLSQAGAPTAARRVA
jgi:ferritin-like metal-binding protein YciE